MGDSASTSTPKCPGIMIVRPSLHLQTDENVETFKRWTIMHFRDLLTCPPRTPDSKGITRALRYTNADGELFYTIHADDIDIWKSPAYYAVSRRLDLENTRAVQRGETAILAPTHSFGEAPMVWHIVDAAFGVFAECARGQPGVQAYQSLSLSVLESSSGQSLAPECLLLTLTCTAPAPTSVDGGDGIGTPEQLTLVCDQALGYLSGEYDLDGKVYASVYRHVPDAQPEMHPVIAEGAEGNGTWVACILAEGGVNEASRTQLQARLEDSVGKVDGRIRVGVWKGEVFMC